MVKRKINFLDVNIRLINRQLETDLHIKPNDTHQFLYSISCHPYHCKKSMPYSQALRYNRICSDNKKFDQSCNKLEKWLMEKGIAFLNEGIPELLSVNSLLTSLNIQRFRMSKAYWRNFKYC